jgi:hypothetical protein
MSRLTEAQFQEQVLHIAELYGWLAYHTRDSRGSQPGFPDLVLLRSPELIFAELKSATGRARPDQVKWLAHLTDLATETESVLCAAAAAGANSSLAIETAVWRPADFDDIVARLSRGRARRRAAA